MASGSPRRREILESLKINFEVQVSEADETLSQPLMPLEAVMELAKRKAQAVTKKKDNEIILAADTVVALGQEILGKPQNKADAYSMLSRLSGTSHFVYTGFCLMNQKKIICDYEKTRVTFRPLTSVEIQAYIKTKEPLDKAGAYGIQQMGALFVSGIEGDYFNVVGLPVCKIFQVLKNEFHYDIFKRE